MDEIKIDSRNGLPLGLSSNNDLSLLLKYLRENQDDLDNKLRQHHGIFFRDSGIKTAQDFHDVVIASGYKEMAYLGGAAVRTQITERVFTANESPSSEKIPFHHELAQTPQPPTHLLFFCEVPPNEGGEVSDE
jgi:alpha-ketoglutarate-dependent taurine dioxygenase